MVLDDSEEAKLAGISEEDLKSVLANTTEDILHCYDAVPYTEVC